MLAIIVVFGGLTVYALSGSWEMQRLKQSASRIRAEFNTARVHAMRSGRIYVFRYTAATGDYTIEPWFAEDDYLNAGESIPAEGQIADYEGEASAENSLDSPNARQLPEGVTFIGASVEQNNRSIVATQRMMNSAAAGQTIEVNGPSVPILFYPDGTASNARVLMTNSNSLMIAVDLRGLTGVAKISPVVPLSEMNEVVQ